MATERSLKIIYPYKICEKCPLLQKVMNSKEEWLLKCSVENPNSAFVYGIMSSRFNINKITYKELVELENGNPPDFCPQLNNK